MPASGPRSAALLIVGLAPGLHGANRTGIPFTGDASGDLLFAVLRDLGINEAVGITNAVKCLPPDNRPNLNEVKRCQRFLTPELSDRRCLLALGRIAHDAILRSFQVRQREHPFAHGVVHQVGDSTIVDSYHCSRYNTQTGRLTEPMFRSVVELAARKAGLLP